jgi:hypothetical protein
MGLWPSLGLRPVGLLRPLGLLGSERAMGLAWEGRLARWIRPLHSHRHPLRPWRSFVDLIVIPRRSVTDPAAVTIRGLWKFRRVFM